MSNYHIVSYEYDGTRLVHGVFTSYDEAEKHREIWQDTETQMSINNWGYDLDGDGYQIIDFYEIEEQDDD